MRNCPKLNFPAVKLRARQQGGELSVWDPLRAVWLVLTPEEWVRRHLIGYLVSCCGAEPMHIVQEYPVELNGQSQRADVVVLDARARPLLLAECKAPAVKIDGATLAQAVRYNSVVSARYLLLTNGFDHYVYELTDEGSYLPAGSVPDLSSL